MAQEKSFRRTNLHWSSPELDRLLRAVKLEDITPPAERFAGIAQRLERTSQSVRAKWLEVRNAALRGQPAASPAVAEYVRQRFPQVTAPPPADDLDALIADYRAAQRQADALLDRIFALAARSDEAMSELRSTLAGTTLAA